MTTAQLFQLLDDLRDDFLELVEIDGGESDVAAFVDWLKSADALHEAVLDNS